MGKNIPLWVIIFCFMVKAKTGGERKTTMKMQGNSDNSFIGNFLQR
jgi:hypothetical protein